MAISYFNETFIKGKKYILNHYRHKKIKDKHLLTTDHGAWVALDDSEFKKVLRYEVDDDLFKLLEEKGIIITEDNISRIVKDCRKRNGYLFRGTSLHIIVPTLRCNHKCIYCHSSAKSYKSEGHDMDKETAKKTLDFIFQTPSKSITIEFQGGDPLLNFDIFKYIVLEAKKMNKTFKKNIRFALVTNLTLMKHEFIEFIEKEGVDICTSLDGPKEVHDKNRIYEDNKPSHSVVTGWIKKLKEEYNIEIPLLMVTTKHSLPFWKEIVDEYVKYNNYTVQIKPMNKLGFANRSWDSIGYSEEDFIRYWEKTRDYIIELNKKGIKVKPRYFNLILQKILTKFDPSFLDFRNPCGMGIGQMVYNHDGDIYCCDEGRNYGLFKLGNVKKNNFKEVISSKKMQDLISSSINDSFICDNCVYKPYCGLCPVLSYAEEGNIISNIGKSRRCRMMKKRFDFIFEKLLFDREIKDIFFDWLFDGKNKQRSVNQISDREKD